MSDPEGRNLYDPVIPVGDEEEEAAKAAVELEAIKNPGHRPSQDMPDYSSHDKTVGYIREDEE